ncbi:hypothetical protein ABT160_43535 [Streptomyces sp. NPDC001941]|uniref:hypothetical protein n=1 Tax=Streptomyces sp. NPDC001941 TaxID=3154659 RepID=UPI0033208F65
MSMTHHPALATPAPTPTSTAPTTQQSIDSLPGVIRVPLEALQWTAHTLGWRGVLVVAVLAIGALYGIGQRRLGDQGVDEEPGWAGIRQAIGAGLAGATIGLARFAGRYLSGRELRGEARTNATFWRPGTVDLDRLDVAELGSVAVAAPAYTPIDWPALRKRWAMAAPDWAQWAVTGATYAGRAGAALYAALRTVWRGLGAWRRWRYAARAAARTAPLAALVGWALSPGWTIVALIAAVPVTLLIASTGGYRAADDEIYGPGIWAGLVQVLRLSEEDQERGADHWLKVAKDVKASDAKITIRLPLYWLGAEGERAILALLIDSRLPGQWVAAYHQKGRRPYAEFTPKPAPIVPEPLPEYVKWEPTDDPYRIHFGETHDGPAYVMTKNATPHIGISGETGSGKSTTAYMPLVNARIHGWLVTLIDPKQNSMVEAQGKSGVRYITETYECVMAIAEFFTSMMAAEKYNSRRFRDYQGTDKPIPRLLIIDELPSFRDFVAAWWKFICKERGFPPVLVWFQIILMQGRSSDHRVVVGTHQYALDVFGSTMARDQVGTKMVVGDTSEPSWNVAYGATTPRLHYDDTIMGRGVISTRGRKRKKMRPDGTPERVEEIQYAYLSPAEINDHLDRAPQAPAWFDRGDMAPWITPADIDKADSAGAVTSFLPGGEYDPYSLPADTEGSTNKGAPRRRSKDHEGVSGAPVSGTVSAQQMAELVERLADEEPVVQRYTLGQACTLGIIDRTHGAARQAKSDALKKGQEFPAGETIKNVTSYTVEELHGFYGVPADWNIENTD